MQLHYRGATYEPANNAVEGWEGEIIGKYRGVPVRQHQLYVNRTYALAMNLLDFRRFLAGCAREKSSNCVSPSEVGMERCEMLPLKDP